MFGLKNENWKPFTLFDGTPVLVPGEFNVTPADDGGWLMYPEGDTTAPPCAWMAEGAYFFDSLNRQQPLDEARLDPADNCEEMQVVSDEEVEHFARRARHYHETTSYGIYMTLPGTAFGDVALVPASLGLDIKMPGLSGMDLLTQVRAHSRDTLFILMTAFGTVESAVEAMKQGAYDYLPKPIDMKRLRALVQKASSSRRWWRRTTSCGCACKPARTPACWLAIPNPCAPPLGSSRKWPTATSRY